MAGAFVILGLFVGFFVACMVLFPKWFEDHWEVLAAGSWIDWEEEKKPQGYVAYTISYPRADLSDLWR